MDLVVPGKLDFEVAFRKVLSNVEWGSSKHGHGGFIRVTFNFPLSELISRFDIVSLWIYTFAFPCWGQQLSFSFQLFVFLFVPLFCKLFKFFS
jgi:hypothetical protein